MGLLSEGSPLEWEATKKLADHVRKHGIIQFINQYERLKERSKDCLLWGDEVEYILVHLTKSDKKARVLLKALPVLTALMEDEKLHPKEHPTTWRPEYASYMVEGTPGRPYGNRMAHFNIVEANMKLRRKEVRKLLASDGSEFAMTLTSFPRLGCPDFTMPESKPTPDAGASRSLFIPEEVIYEGHPRFRTLTRNIRERKGRKVAINIPIFKDVNTPSPFIEDFSSLGDIGDEAKNAALPDHIYLDAMAFGMGCCCLQMTFQACNIQEARLLYDQLTPLCPILLALSAASPVHRGYLADTDCRWNVISGSVDDRTLEELGLKPLEHDRFVINKSRYDSIDSYLSPGHEKYNDIPMVLDKDIYDQLRTAGIDHLLAQHVAHLFIRDPVSVFSEKINQDDSVDTDHFENIQSTNWQTMRFKPPPPNTDIGWRVEFRPTEVQLTDFENAAYMVFMVLLTRVILSFQLNFMLPISKVDENMRNAQKQDAIRNQKFYFKKDITPSDFKWKCSKSPEDCASAASKTSCSESMSAAAAACEHAEYGLFTVEEIICGKGDEFPGLVPLIDQYLHSIDDVDVDTNCTISQYLRLIKDRASGKLMTTAHWIRKFVTTHPAYKKDSVVSDVISYDLIQKCVGITYETIEDQELLMKHKTRTEEQIPTAMQKTDDHLASMAAKLISVQEPPATTDSRFAQNGTGDAPSDTVAA